MSSKVLSGQFAPGTELKVGSHDVTIKGYISEGGFAHVYVVDSSPPSGGTEVACLKRVLVPDKIHLNLLRAEVDAMKRLKGHPNIVRYIDSHAARLPEGNGVYEVLLLMEYCSGNGLIDFMNTRLREQLTESEILKIMYDITSGLACMHYLQPPLLHRDLKIENVLISGDGTYKLCDFGSTSPVLRPPRNSQEFGILQNDIQRNTTAQYRSPEMVDIYRGFPIDEKSDIWALGVFLYKLCYYTTPFEREGQMAILHARFIFPPKPAYSDRLKRIISVCLSEDPRLRPNVYQVLREICSMRNVDVPIKDIYGGKNVADTNELINAMATPKAAGAIQRSSLNERQPSPERRVPEIKPMYRGRPPKSSPSLVSGSVSNDQAVFDDAFKNLDKDFQKSVVRQSSTGLQPNFNRGQTLPTRPARPAKKPLPAEPILVLNDGEDVESRFPSLEELSSTLEKSTTSNDRPKESSNNSIAYKYPASEHSTQTENLPINGSFGIDESMPPRPRTLRPRPVSMYTKGSDNYGMMSNESVESLSGTKSPSTSAFLASKSQSDSSSSSGSLESLYIQDLKTSAKSNGNDRLGVEERETLKNFLTGVSQHSVNLELENQNHIDSNVDFLRSLHNDGHSISRANSAGGNRNSLYTRSASESSRKANRTTSSSSRHSTHNSFSSIKNMFNEAFRGSNVEQRKPSETSNGRSSFETTTSDTENYRPKQQRTSDYLRNTPDDSSKNIQNTTDGTGITRSRESYGDIPSRRSADSERPPLHRGTSRGIQNRIHNFLRQKSPPPRRTAEGYGKYTDKQQQSSGESLISLSSYDEPVQQTQSARTSSEYRKEPSPISTMLPPQHPVGRVIRPDTKQHDRHLSDISSSSGASDKKVAPVRPKKPSHLQSPAHKKERQTPEFQDEDFDLNFHKRYPDVDQSS